MGRRPSGRLPAQPLTYLWEYHREIARRLVCGDRQCDIARDLGLTESRLSIIVNSPEHQRLVHELSTEKDAGAVDVSSRLRRLSSNAIDVLESVIKKQTAPLMVGLQVKVAEMILDRAGHGPTKNINQGGRVEHTVAAEGVLGSALEALRKRAGEGSNAVGGSSTCQAREDDGGCGGAGREAVPGRLFLPTQPGVVGSGPRSECSEDRDAMGMTTFKFED